MSTRDNAACESNAGHGSLEHCSATRNDESTDSTWLGCHVRHYVYGWQVRHESSEQRQEMLERIRSTITARAAAHLTAGQDSVLVLATPPGTGKSTAVATLGQPGGSYGLNLAWIAERHDMAKQVPALAHYNHIEKCTPDNCPDGYLQHQMLLDRGLTTWPFHQRHQCAYAQQFRSGMSTFYQLAHVHTAHPVKHPDGIVIDELNLTKWLEPYDVTHQRLLDAEWYTQEGSSARQLLTATLAVLHAARLQRTALHGASFYRELDRQLGGQLLDMLEELRAEPDATRLYVTPTLSTEAVEAVARLREVPVRVLAHLWHGLNDEVEQYRQSHGDVPWNSRLHVEPGHNKKSDWTLRITAARMFRVDDAEALPPRIVLDGTADVQLLKRLMPGAQVMSYTVAVPDDLPPPPHMRHIAVRKRTTCGGVKRYSKTSLTYSPSRGSRQSNSHSSPTRAGSTNTQGPQGMQGLRQAINDVSFVLDQLDSGGTLRQAGKVGLITFEGVEGAMRQALSIPDGMSGHFWAMRGSNQLAQCDILLVVGRPALSEEDIFRMGSFLYAEDEDAEPLAPGPYKAQDNTYHFCDARLEHLASSLTRAELTQCAHRNRPLIFDHRTVVTFCDEDIDFLPVTTEVEQLPHHLGQLSDNEKLGQAAAVLKAHGVKETVAALQHTLKEMFGKGLHRQTVVQWHKAHSQRALHAA